MLVRFQGQGDTCASTETDRKQIPHGPLCLWIFPIQLYYNKNYSKLRAGRGSRDQNAVSKISLVSCSNDKNNGTEEERAWENTKALGRNSAKLMQPKIKCDLHAVPFNLVPLWLMNFCVGGQRKKTKQNKTPPQQQQKYKKEKEKWHQPTISWQAAKEWCFPQSTLQRFLSNVSQGASVGDGQAQHRTLILRHCLTDKDFNWSIYASSPPATQICSDNVF